MSQDSLPYAYKGEAMLLRWSESHKGRTVTLLLEDGAGDHPFKGLKQGDATGQRMGIMCVLVGDDEMPQPPPEAKENGPRTEAGSIQSAPVAPHADQANASDRPRAFKDFPRSQQAALRCQDADFQTWLGASSAEHAKMLIYERCGIQTRRSLDSADYPNAIAAFDKLMTDFSVRGYAR